MAGKQAKTFIDQFVGKDRIYIDGPNLTIDREYIDVNPIQPQIKYAQMDPI